MILNVTSDLLHFEFFSFPLDVSIRRLQLRENRSQYLIDAPLTRQPSVRVSSLTAGAIDEMVSDETSSIDCFLSQATNVTIPYYSSDSRIKICSFTLSSSATAAVSCFFSLRTSSTVLRAHARQRPIRLGLLLPVD